MSLFDFFKTRKLLSADNSLLSDTGLSATQVDFFKKYLEFFPDSGEVSIAFVNNDDATFAGIRRIHDLLTHTGNMNSAFEIGSVTKVFTSLLFSKFIDIGLVKLDDPIKTYFAFPLKQSNLGGVEINLNHLANHTSGLPRIDMSMFVGKERGNIRNPYKNYTEEKLNDYLKNRMKLKTVPGTKFSYSNLGGGLLAFILCKKTNKTYEELLQENIFSPLNMINSTTDINKVKTEFIRGLTRKGTEAINWEYTDATAGAGAIKSTVADMARFIQAHFTDNTVFRLLLQKTFPVKENTDIGLAWLITRKGGNTIYWHNGGTGGYRSCVAFDLISKKGVIILSNVSASHPKNKNIDELCFLLLESMK